MATKYAFDNDNNNVRRLNPLLASISYQETEEHSATLTFVVDEVQCVPDLFNRPNANRSFGQMALNLKTHLSAVKFDGDTYYVVDDLGRSHNDAVEEDGNAVRLSNYRNYTYHVNSGEIKYAINAGAYDDIDRFNSELDKSLKGTEFTINSKATLTCETVKDTDGTEHDYVKVDKVEKPVYFDEETDSNFDLLLLSGFTKVQADFERRSSLRQRSDKERAEALAQSNVKANDISYEREDVGRELDLGDTENPDDALNSSDKSDEKDTPSSNPKDETTSSVRRRSEGKDMSYNPDADDDLDF